MSGAEGRTPSLTALIEANIWPILCATASAGAGVLIGMTTANHRLDVLEADVAELKQQGGGRRDFMVCAARNLDRLNDKTGTEPVCQLDVPE